MAPPSQVPAPKKPTKTYYAPDDETSYSSHQSVTYGKKQTHPIQSTGARESSRPVNKESTISNSTNAASKPGPNKTSGPSEGRKRPRSPSQSAPQKLPRRAPSPARSRRPPSRSRDSPSRDRRSSRSRRSASRSRRSASRGRRSRSRSRRSRSRSRGRRSRSCSVSRDRDRAGRTYNVGGEQEMDNGIGEEIREEQEIDEEMDEEIRFSSARAGPSKRAESPHTSSDTEIILKAKDKGKAVRAYDDDIDEMRSEVENSWRKITKLQEDVAAIKSLRGDVAMLKQQLTGLEQTRREVQALRTDLKTFIVLVGSNSSQAELQAFADKVSSTIGAVSDSRDPIPVATAQSSKPKRSHKKKVDDSVVTYDAAKERILVDHSRRTIYRLLGISMARQLRPPIQNEDKTYQFWADDENGVKVMYPVWGPQLGMNKSAKTGWVPQFVEACQDTDHMTANKGFLMSVPGDKFISVLENTTWPGLWDKWKEIEKGTVDEKEAKGRVRGREYNRANLKGKARDNARPGTEVAGPAGNFLVHRDLQSPEISDSEDSNRKCVDQALWRSKKYVGILDALTLKDKLSKTKPSPASRTNVVYYKTNAPIPVLLGGLRVPLWAVCPTWIANNKTAFEASQCSIDRTAVESPDVTALLEHYPRTRTYVGKRPIRAKAEGSYTVDSPPHIEAPLPSDQPVPREDDSEPPEFNAPPQIIPGPPDEPRILDPTIEPLLQGPAGTIVVPPQSHPLPFQPLPPPINCPPPYPMAQSNAAFAAQRAPGQHYAPPTPLHPQPAVLAAPQPAANAQPGFPSHPAPQIQPAPSFPFQQAVSQSAISEFQTVRDAARDFLYQQNDPSVPNAHLDQEPGRWQDQPKAPVAVYQAPPMPPPPPLAPAVPASEAPPEDGPQKRPARACRAPQEKKNKEAEIGGSAGGDKTKRGGRKGRGK